MKTYLISTHIALRITGDLGPLVKRVPHVHLQSSLKKHNSPNRTNPSIPSFPARDNSGLSSQNELINPQKEFVPFIWLKTELD